MRAQVPVRCSDELHWLTVEDDGTLIIESDEHDVDLEMSLAEMGGTPPLCIKMLTDWSDHPSSRSWYVVLLLTRFAEPADMLRVTAEMVAHELRFYHEFPYPKRAVEVVAHYAEGLREHEDLHTRGLGWPTPDDEELILGAGMAYDRTVSHTAKSLVATAFAFLPSMYESSRSHWHNRKGHEFARHLNQTLTGLAAIRTPSNVQLSENTELLRLAITLANKLESLPEPSESP